MISPVELGAELTDAGRAGIGDNAEVAAAEITVRIHELRVIEDVEELGSNLDAHRFGDSSNLLQPQIRVQKAWSMEELTVCCTKLAWLLRDKCIRKEIRVGAIWSRVVGILNMDRPHQIRCIGIRTA